jgi:predicted AlkP superfamily phosphohydrolase/phosphomutase
VTPTRVLYVALDACDARLAVDLAGQGVMPTLASLLDSGAVATTRAPTGFFVSAHWPTLSTGLAPDRHDYYCWKELRAGTYDDEITTPREVEGVPFWEELSASGRRVAVLDVPHTEADPGLDGCMVVEWGCHDRHFGTHSTPASLIDELERRFGRHPIGTSPPAFGDPQFAPCDYRHRAGPHRTAAENQALWAELLDGQQRKHEASLHLLDQGGWDLFVTVLGESHCVGHQLWHLHDPDHPWHDPVQRTALGDPVVEMYRRLDATLGAHLDRTDDSTAVYVHLSHGMAPHYDGTHLLDALLDRIDQSFDASRRPGLRTQLAGRALGPLSTAQRQRVSRFLAPAIRQRAASAPPRPHVIDRPRSDRRWFEVPNNTVVGAVRLNVVGREPEGRLPAHEVDRWCTALRESLLEVVNVATGEPVVDDVVRFDDVYRARPGHAFPDLLVEWNRSAPIETVWSRRSGTVHCAYDHWRTGDHRDYGLLVARGAGVAPGRLPTEVDTVDIGVTLCAAAGLDRDDVDGRPVARLVPRPAHVR